MEPTTTGLRINVAYYMYLKYLGIFPYKFSYKLSSKARLETFTISKTITNEDLNNPSEKREKDCMSTLKVSILRNGFAANLANFVLIIWALKSIFTLTQLFRYSFSRQSNSKLTLGFVCFAGSTFASLAIQIKFRQYGQKLCDLMNSVHEIEQEIFRKSVQYCTCT